MMSRLFSAIILLFSCFPFLINVSGAQTMIDPPCGSVIRQGETALLTQDLVCTGSGITLIGGTLDMGGHSLECLSRNRGIEVYGDASVLQNGTITGCSFGVYVRPFFGSGGHEIRKITSTGNFAGFAVFTHSTTLHSVTASDNVTGIMLGASESHVDDIKLMFSSALQNGACGIEVGINARDTKIFRNTIIGNGHQGLCDFGSGSQVVGNLAEGNHLHGFQYGGPNAISEWSSYRSNRATGNRLTGFLISGRGGALVANRATNNGQNGFLVGIDANDNTLWANWASDNGDGQTTLDILDEEGDCADNTYRANHFNTATSCVQ
jgi:hypothetical protein